jgi:hypothetical protein
LFWNEEGFRFSWRVMLMEKVCNFYREMLSPKEIVVNNSHFDHFQEKQMVFQPDFILNMPIRTIITNNKA